MEYQLFALVIPQFIKGLILVSVYLLVVLVLRRILLRQISRAAEKSATRWDDLAISALRGPILLLIAVSTAWVADRFAGLPIAQD